MLLKTLNAFSLPGGLTGELEPSDAIRGAKEHGYDAVELAVSEGGPFGLDVTEARCREIRAEADAAGIRLPSLASGLYWSRSLGDADPEARARAADDLRRMIGISAWLGATTLLIIPGAVDVFFLPDRPAQPHDEVLRNAEAGLREVLPLAEAHGVRLGIENVWNRLFLTATELRDFIDRIGSPNLGSYFDVGNALPFGYPEDWIRTLGRRIVGVHFKDFRRAVGTAEGFVDLLEGDVDWPVVVAALEEIGYAGPVAAEMIPHYRHHPMVRVANASRAMDAILGRG